VCHAERHILTAVPGGDMVSDGYGRALASKIYPVFLGQREDEVIVGGTWMLSDRRGVQFCE